MVASKQAQGRTANRNGQMGEVVIQSILRDRRILYDRQRRLGLSIYETELRVDFYCYGVRSLGSDLIIECKRQEQSGSADEKLPYLVENIKACYPCPAIIVVSGDGMRAGALRWLRRQVDTRRLYAVFSLEEFMTWASSSL